ncbi:MAG: hypothetical protein WC707_05995 [Candidatus Babeliaceae bacterium]|jgi:hypothetical protein
MYRIRILAFAVFLPLSLFGRTATDKTFQHVNVITGLRAQDLFIPGNATIGNTLYVNHIIANSIISASGSSGGGSGNVQGPASSTLNAVPRFADTSGTVIKDSSVLVDDAGNITIDGITKNGITISWPSIAGGAGTFLASDGFGNLIYTAPPAPPIGGGNVSSQAIFFVDNALTTTDPANGPRNIKSTFVTLDAFNNIDNVNTLTAATVNASIVGDVTGNVAGAASLNVLKSGDTMTGNLAFATQNGVQFQEAAGTNFVGLNAPTTVPLSYTLSLPSTIPLANQTLRANALTPTNLEWFTSGANVVPTISRTIYVAKYGSDITGDGSLTSPFASLAQAINLANTIASPSNPLTIFIYSGVYVENNSAGPIAVTAGGISIVGEATNSVFILPNTLSNDLVSCIVTTRIDNLSFNAGGVSTATGVVLSGANNVSHLSAVRFLNFNTGVSCAGSGSTYVFDLCNFILNTTGLNINNPIVVCNNCTIQGSLTNTPANTGIMATGSSGAILYSGGLCTNCITGFTISDGITFDATSVLFRNNTNGIIQTTGAQLIAQSCFFQTVAITGTVTNIQVYDAGSLATISGGVFNGINSVGSSHAIALQVENSGSAIVSAGQIENYTTACVVGTPADTSSTQLSLSGTFILNCTNDIVQQGSSTLNFNAGSATSDKISIANSANVDLAFFDQDDANALNIGSLSNTRTTLLQVAIGAGNKPQLDYIPSLYSTEAISYVNSLANPSTLSVISNDDAHVDAITTDYTKVVGVRLASDTASPVGTTGALRGWDINKNATTAELAFNYQNNDPAGGQATIPKYIVMQLDGVNNQVQLPNAGTKIVLDADTNIYRSAAGILKTDGNLIVGGLTPNKAVVTDGSSQLASSVTTATELGFLSGTTSSVQTQLNSKLPSSGGTVTGNLTLPAGSIASPSLQFSGSTNTGFSAPVANTLSFDVNGVEAININAAGNVKIDDLNSVGVVHTDASGTLSTSLIVNNDITNGTITDVKLATISTPGKVANSATTATSLDTPNAIVARDGSGDFAAGTITSSLIGNVTGASSLNVLKTGDTMTGNLTMATANAVRFQDGAGANYVGLNAPALVASNYTLSLPSTIPTAHQVMWANATTPTNLEWVTSGGTVIPAASRIIYVAQYGNDTTGDGSFATPYASLAKAVNVANTLSTTANPIAISIMPGVYTENNSAGPIAITAGGISIIGDAPTGVVIRPNTLSNDLISATTAVQFTNITFRATGVSTASAVTLAGSGNTSNFIAVSFFNFNTGVACGGSNGVYLFDICFFVNNGTALNVNNAQVQCSECNIRGSLTSTPANTGIAATGAAAQILYSGGLCLLCDTAFNIAGNALFGGKSITFRLNNSDIFQASGAQLTLEACSFVHTSSASPFTSIQSSGAGTMATIAGCIFDYTGTPTTSTAIQVTDQAQLVIDSGSINNYVNAFVVGVPADTASTQLNASGVSISNCTNDMVQRGTSTLVFSSGTATGSKIVVNDSTNIALAYFDVEDNYALNIGNLTNDNFTLLHAALGLPNDPQLDYRSSLYSTRGMGFYNPPPASTTLFVESNSGAMLTAITTDRTQPSGVRLVSDTASPVGTTGALRGWDINKIGTAAELVFNYQNSDSFGQAVIPEYTIMQLDGVNNQVQLPSASTKIVLDTDTNLYRGATGTLKTDGNLIVGGLTANRAVATDGSSQLVSSATTAAELGFLVGTTSDIQTQLNSKVAKAGDTMTGTLQLPAGSTAAPTLVFTGSTTTGLSASAGALSLSTSGLERMKISSGGTVSINNLTPAGIVHNDVSGNLTSSLIVNADVDPAAAIVDTKLATISTAGKVANSATTATSGLGANTIVERDGSNNFSAGTITATLIGAASLNVLKSGDTMTGALTLPAGTAASPALKFSGSINTGLSSPTVDALSFDVNGTEALNIASSGNITVNNFTGTAGVVHNSALGVLTSSLIINSDITPATISNASLATISSTDTAGNIVVRDGTGNFATNMITLDGTVTNPTDAATKAYVDLVAGLGFVVKTPALVVSTTDTPITGLYTIDSVPLAANDRVLLVGQSTTTQNGLWLAQAGAWTRPADFATGTLAGRAYVLILSGTNNGGSSWLCSTPLAVIDTDPIAFTQFSLASQTTGANVGTGAGQIFRDKTGNTLNFKTLAAGTHMVVTNNADDVTLATDATNLNATGTIVARDNAGNFSAGTITAALIGAASLNVLKAGDTMTGNLTMATSNAVRLQDLAGVNYVGLNGPASVTSSYTLSLPSTTPAAHQVMQANAITPTQLEWFTPGGSVNPVTSRTIYVTTFGSDITGDGSSSNPYASLSKAITTANTISTAVNPVAILISSGVYTEDNSAGPLAITAGGVSVIGESTSSVIILPNTLSNNLISTTISAQFLNLSFSASGISTASAVSLSGSGNNTFFNNIDFTNFGTAVSCGGTSATYTFESCFFITNGVGLAINNASAICSNCIIEGSTTFTTPANVGISATGTGFVFFTGGLCIACATGFDISNGMNVTTQSITFRFNSNSIIQSTSAQLIVQGCTFEPNSLMPVVEIQVSGAGTDSKLSGCIFNGAPGDIGPTTAIQVTNQANVIVSGDQINNYTNALIIGTLGDTASTQLSASSLYITNCTTDITQQALATLNFTAGSASGNKIIINNPTNVGLAYFDQSDNNALNIGSATNADITLLHAAIGTANDPQLNYRSSLYSTESIGFYNPQPASSTLFVESNSGAHVTALTTDRTQAAGVRLVSDTASPVGTTGALRGWDINKNATSAELSFNYQNSDSFGQIVIPEYTIMQLDGVNNQVQLPNASTKIVLDADTNVYRGAANTLKTDGNLIVGGLTPNRAVATDGSSQLVSSTTTAAELDFLAGTTSSVQTQLNSKVAKAGDTMTGTLQLPAGSTAAPALVFTGSTTTGLSASAGALSLSTSAVERLKISSGGTISIDAFTTAGVVHNDALGNLSSSLIVNADVDPAAAIADTKLATISASGKVANTATTATNTNTPNTIVLRDGSGNFSAGTITANLIGNVIGNISPTGTFTVQAGTRAVPSIQFTGSTNTGFSAPEPNTLSFDINGIEAINISSSRGVLIDNFTGTAGIVHNDALGNLSSSLIVDADVSPSAAITDNKLATISTPGKVANSATTATSANLPNTIVLRDASGNFSAGTITAGLIGNVLGNVTGSASLNVLKSGDTMTGNLTLPAGTRAVPSLQFSGGTNTGLSSPSANTLSFDINGVEAINISSSRGVLIDNFTGTAGIVHNDALGNLSSSLIVNADVSPSAAITDDKLATISTSGKVANSATTATSVNLPNTIVLRDASGNFSAGTITAAFSGTVTGNVIGSASLNVLKAGDTMTGTLQLPAGSTAAPALVFTGSTTTGLSASTGNLSLSTSAVERLKISSSGTVTITGLTPAGVVHNDVSGNLSSSLIINADVDPAAAIIDTKLATISTAGKVANTATTATALDTAGAIVARDASGNFAAGTITAGLIGNVTGSASLNVLKSGDTMTGNLTLPAGTNISPSLKFSGSTNTGLSSPVANTLSLSINGTEAINIASSGNILIDNFTGTAGIVHNSALGLLTSSLIVDADVSPSAGIVDTKLATILTPGKVGNSATTATGANSSNTIVARDNLGNFAASTITANLLGNVTGSASLNVLKAGDTMTGTLTHPAGTRAAPSIQFTGSTNTGFSSPSANTLSFDVNGTEAINISSSGGILIDNFTGTAGVVHNSALGLLTSSLIVNSDITPGTISNASLASISSANTPNTIVLRDASGDFSAGTITAALIGNVTGAASLNVLKAGDTMTGSLVLPAGTAAVPALQFTGSTNTGFSAPTANTLSFDTNGAERMSVSSGSILMPTPLVTTNVRRDQAIQSATPTVGGSVTTLSTTSILILKNVVNVGGAGFTVRFPPSPIDGQFFTIVQGSTNSTTLVNTGGTGGAAIVNPVNSLAPGSNFTSSTNGAAVTYYYNATANTWYRIGRG